MAYYDALIAKWPSVTGATTQEKLNNLNAELATGPRIRAILPTYSIYNAIAASDFQALSSGAQQYIRDVLSLGTVDASSDTQARAVVQSIFSGSSATLSALSDLVSPYDSPQIPWWQANGYPRAFDLGDIATAGLS